MPHSNKTVLIVDNNEDTITSIKQEILSMFPKINIVTENSYKATAKHILLQHENIDIAIVNYEIPDADDGMVVEFILDKEIPVIALTNNEKPEVINELLSLDIMDYILTTETNDYHVSLASVYRILRNYDINVLVVDDSSFQLSVAVKMLKKLKLNITTAMDGKEALDILNSKKTEFSLILTDYNMPIMDGMELTKYVRKEYSKDQLGIIVLSANNLPEVPTKFIKLGANDFINKPYKQIEVNTRINSNLETLELFQTIKDSANRDFLTKAYNRRYFFDSGSAIFSKAKRNKANLAVAMLDIDKFKNINDTYGHDVGDVAICEVARILNENLRDSDLMARFGGEEFCVLLDNITIEDTAKLFEKIRAAFEANIITIGDLKIQYNVSIGICYGMEDDLEEMIKKSDDGLYYCKNNGRNQVAINK